MIGVNGYESADVEIRVESDDGPEGLKEKGASLNTRQSRACKASAAADNLHSSLDVMEDRFIQSSVISLPCWGLTSSLFGDEMKVKASS